MADLHLDADLLRQFEAGLDPRRPEASAIPARVLGYGEISTVLRIDGPQPAPQALAYRRMPMFRSVEEADRYEQLHRRYVRALGERAGVRVAPCATARVIHPTGRVVVYIAQEQMPDESIANMAIYRLPSAEVDRLVLAVLQETVKVFDFNQDHRGELELGFNAQISNWAIAGLRPERLALPERIRLVYLDTSTPLMRRHGQEQLDPELFLRGAPRYLLPLVRRAFLPDVMTRYYDLRRITLDLVANFRKEGRPELIPSLIDTVNWYFLADRQEQHFQPLTIEETRQYYRWDALIWRVYLALRKLDRWLCRLRGKDYPYLLPPTIHR